jgi:hypothetical protein
MQPRGRQHVVLVDSSGRVERQDVCAGQHHAVSSRTQLRPGSPSTPASAQRERFSASGREVRLARRCLAHPRKGTHVCDGWMGLCVTGLLCCCSCQSELCTMQEERRLSCGAQNLPRTSRQLHESAIDTDALQRQTDRREMPVCRPTCAGSICVPLLPSHANRVRAGWNLPLSPTFDGCRCPIEAGGTVQRRGWLLTSC